MNQVTKFEDERVDEHVQGTWKFCRTVVQVIDLASQGSNLAKRIDQTADDLASYSSIDRTYSASSMSKAVKTKTPRS